jgi:O-antigen ligase
MLIPIAIAVAIHTKQKRWWLAVALLVPGAISSVSRTTILMLAAILIVYLCLRPREVKRCWPALLPLVVVVHFAIPGTIGTLYDAFFPKGGLVAQQTNTAVGSGRLATLGPTLKTEFDPNPVFGEGFATRVTTDEDPSVPANAPITDDQWLGVALETGLVGLLMFAALIVSAVRRLGREARRDRSSRGWLCVGLAASVTSYAVGMVTLDSFTFYEVTFLFFTLLGLSGAVLLPDDVRVPTVAPVRTAGALVRRYPAREPRPSLGTS